mgnify:CR=1 FL=1
MLFGDKRRIRELEAMNIKPLEMTPEGMLY